MSCPGRAILEACAARELEASRAAAIEAHAAACASCGRRLRWFRHENEAIQSWVGNQPEDIERLWAPILARIEGRPARRRWQLPALLAAATAAAIALYAVHRPEDPDDTPSAAAAMAQAEEEYATAVASLEAQVEARHVPSGRSDSALIRARRGLASAWASAGSDPGARVRVLEGYAAYLKSLRRALQDESP